MSTETTKKKIKIDNGTTFGKTYTDKAIDAKLPTDLIASANKLSLGAGNSVLGNGVNLDGFTYDEATKTLKAEGSGATLPAGTAKDPFILNKVIKLYDTYAHGQGNNGLTIASYSNSYIDLVPYDSSVAFRSGSNAASLFVNVESMSSSSNFYIDISLPNNKPILDIYAKYPINTHFYIPVLKHPSADGTYNLQITKTGSSYHYDWVAGGGGGLPTYNHYIVISDGTASNAIYLLIPSTNSLICSSLPELNTLLGTTNRFIQASGVVTDAASKLPIVAIKWQGSFSSSKIVTMSSEEATTKFTDISDIVEPA